MNLGMFSARGEEFEKSAEKKVKGWDFFNCLCFGLKYIDAADLYQKAAYNFKLAKAWDRVAAAYMKKAECHSKMNFNHKAALTYVDAASASRKDPLSTSNVTVSCLEKAVRYFLGAGQIIKAAGCYKEIAELYESKHDLAKAMAYFQESADLYKAEDSTASANQCLEKVAYYAAWLEQYSHAIEAYEAMVLESPKGMLSEYRVREYILNAGLCKLCKGDDVVAISKSLAKYQVLDPTFARSSEYKFLADLAAAVDADDVAQFTHLVEQFDRIPLPLDELKTTLLSRVKQTLKVKEFDKDDLA